MFLSFNRLLRLNTHVTKCFSLLMHCACTGNMPNYDSEEVVASVSEIASLGSIYTQLSSSLVENKTYVQRMNNLVQFRKMISENTSLIGEALLIDLHQNDPTPHITDCLSEVEYMISNLANLMKPKHVSSEISVVNFPARAKIVPEPLGVVLIVGSWNYPFHTALGPVPGALAAGNSILVKPGSLSRNSSRVMGELLVKYFPNGVIQCVQGGIETMTPLLTNSWGHVFFTGGTKIGKIIMDSCSKTLTPVTLELGGQNPCIVTACADIALAARRIAWGKWATNAGQVCLAPNHVIVDESVAHALITELKKCIEQFFPNGPEADSNFCHIISKSHKKRLCTLLERDSAYVETKSAILNDKNSLCLPPTIVDFKSDWNAFINSACMENEIFGPILPIVTYTNFHATVDKYLTTGITRNNAPLALYVFSKSDACISAVTNTMAGTVVVNDTGMHIVERCLPFGGIGNSGIGCYHGKSTFDLFTHYKPILTKSGWMDIPFRYPPVSILGAKIVKFLLWLGRKEVTPLWIGKILLILGLVYKVMKT